MEITLTREQEERLKQPPTTIEQILADSFYDLAPERSKEDWLKHVQLFGNDAEKFFGTNGEGYQEYLAFTRKNDKDVMIKHLKEQKDKKVKQERLNRR